MAALRLIYRIIKIRIAFRQGKYGMQAANENNTKTVIFSSAGKILLFNIFCKILIC